MLRPGIASLAFVLVALAGCAGEDAVSGAVDGESRAGGDGRLCVIAVDEAIRPIGGANVTAKLADGSSRFAVSDDTGMACLDLPPGTYILDVRHIHQTYREAQTTGEVVAGGQSTVKVQLERLFEQEPYHETTKFDGFIQCGYDVTVASSICVQDYTHFVGPYTCPECEHLLDRRSTNFELGGGWQTLVVEMTWDATAQGTSDEMRVIISHFPRSASHWYCSGAGADPVLVRMELGVVCEDQQSDPDLVPPEGLPNMHLFAATNAPDGQFASVTFSQAFSVFMNGFYYGKPPEGWSFIAGDEFPF
ncbi:MAG: carboxypeptidase-like regulatory domain-containing protein [Thermoplasmatota archaeon]